MRQDLFVTGTDTGVGKTLLSALLVAALNRKYWKPIQTGASEGTDTQNVMKWAGVSADRTLPEAVVFDPPVSPHLAAEQQGSRIDLLAIRRPADPHPIVIEGAGGVYVPINDDVFMLDLMGHLNAPVVVAARTALGTINHTLLTISAIRSAGLELRGVVMVGKENRDNRRAVEHYGEVPVIGSIPWLDSIERTTLCRVFEQHFDRTAFA
ncbi:MAG TPA: dethiobiotin synthase [Terriglobia bacterium]|nr:dethiobiotin synthase [Terriglobia bacterium]